MFSKMQIANRGDNGRKGVAAKPDSLMRAAQSGGLALMEMSHV